jgi:site-specific recombinase XerD
VFILDGGDFMGTISNFGDKLSRYKFCSKDVRFHWGTKTDGEELHKRYSLIGVEDTKNGVEVIHPLSDFIISNWRGNKYNTQRKRVNEIVPFLNFIKDNYRSIGITSFTELDKHHGTHYLNSLTLEGKAQGTVKDAERTLTKFFVWLSKKELLRSLTINDFTYSVDQYGRKIYDSPFACHYPSRKTSNIEHLLPMEYIPLLIEIAILVAKPIALGIYIQIFGGVRVGEIANLKRTQAFVRARKGDFTFKLEDRDFRKDLRDSAYVKKKRYQTVMNMNDWLPILMSDHLSLYKPKDESDALFINRNGQAMSERSYRQYFQKVKDEFIKYLRSQGKTETTIIANHLATAKWSTHIGRGTFTNMIAEYAQTPNEIAQLRGDSSIDSSLSYMSDTDRLRSKIEKKMSEMHNNYIPRLIKDR